MRTTDRYNIEDIEKWMNVGETVPEIAVRLGVHRRTLWAWLKKNVDIRVIVSWKKSSY